MKRASRLALLLGKQTFDPKFDKLREIKAEKQCNMGVGCGITGVCFAAANGKPEMCGRVKNKNDE